MITNYYGKDQYNKKKRRGLDTVNRFDFNCGGYALETYNWYLPVEGLRQASRYFDSWYDEDREEVLEDTVKHMLKEFKGKLRIIQNVEELKDNEYAIAYRIGDGDFHFAKRNKKGVWFHKRGKTPYIERMTKEEVFSSSWGHRYDSPIVLFAKIR